MVVVANALGGSFKLVTLAPKNCKGDDSTAQGNTKEWGNKQVSLANHLASTDNLTRTTKRQHT